MPAPLVLALLLARVPGPPAAAVWRPQASGVAADLRGLAAVSAKIAWATGARGTVLRTVDGETWKPCPVPGAEALDFRDVHALDARRAWILAAGVGGAGRIYRTADGGATWNLSYTNPEAEGFLDALAFWDETRGLALGDPVRGRFQVLRTEDGGTTWTPVPDAGLPSALENEGAFAASGTCLTTASKEEAWFVTGGGKTSRVFRTTDGGRTWSVHDTPVPAGAASKGLFTVVVLAPTVVVLGGDYRQPSLGTLNGAFSDSRGLQWRAAPAEPKGLLSGSCRVPGIHGKGTLTFLAVGLAGTGLSRDSGRTWHALDTTPLHAVSSAGPGATWAVGPQGRILKLEPSALKR